MKSIVVTKQAYPLYRYLKFLGVNCTIVTPGKIPRQSSDKIKTDKRDAIKFARLLRSGELESIHGEEDEAVRDYLRSRDSLRLDLGRNRQRLMKFLLRKGIRTCPKRNSMTLLPAASGTEPETSPIERPLGSEILSSGSVLLSSSSLIFLIK
ncbi:Transposase [Leptospira santarosai]|uniref:Transposase n=1 Tax=Leptospira santarosai TaxID=28183 RepID=A0A2P1QNP4_9LEPT|nr:Transposase [Leptospira santarosai]